MKKTRFIALALVVAIALAGAGYAVWTKQLVVNGELSTGNMNVQLRVLGQTVPTGTKGTITPEKNKTGDTITFTASDLYPMHYGDKSDDRTFGRIHFAIENKGTVPVKLESIEFIKSGDQVLWDWLRTDIHIHYGTPSATGTSLATEGNLMNGPNSLRGNLGDLDKILLERSELSTFVLEPGKAIWFGHNDEELSSIRYWLDEEAGNDTQGKEVGFTLKFNWIQAID